MRPQQLASKDFSSYPPQAQKLAIDHLAILRRVPLALLPTLLRDMQDFDWKFPPEQGEVIARLKFVEDPLRMAEFTAISVPDALARLPWVNEPQHFIEEFTAYLWSSRNMDLYHRAATEFVRKFEATVSPMPPLGPRLVMVMIGRDAKEPIYPLFENLAPHGEILTQVNASDALPSMKQAMLDRAEKWPGDYTHWYVDGGTPFIASNQSGISQLVYPALAPVNQRILERMSAAIQAGTGPEVLRTELGRLAPSELSADKVTNDSKLQHLAVSILTEASGTQIFSTSFVQWTAREVLRRAQPTTLCVRFAPRQKQQAFNAMVHAAVGAPQTDPEGSLIDADMGAYYTYLEMKKLPEAERATFLVYLESRSQAFISGPGVSEGKRRNSPATLSQVLQMPMQETT